MEFEMLGYTVVQNEAGTNVRLYRNGLLVLYFPIPAPLTDRELLDLLAAVCEQDGGRL